MFFAESQVRAFSFSSLGPAFGFMPITNPGDVQMPSTLLRWGLLFVSSVFIPLTYAQDVMNHAVLGSGLLNPWLDLAVLALSGVLFLWPSIRMHRRAQVLGGQK